MKDFTHIAYVGGSPIVVTAHASLGVNSLAELMALMRRSRSTTGYVSPGVGSLGHLVGEYLARKENVALEHVPYKGGVQAVTDLIAGHVKVGVMTWTTSSPHIRSGKLTALAVSSARRLPQLPDLPTLKELGYADLVTTTWWAFSGPAKLPGDIVSGSIARSIRRSMWRTCARSWTRRGSKGKKCRLSNSPASSQARSPSGPARQGRDLAPTIRQLGHEPVRCRASVPTAESLPFTARSERGFRSNRRC